MRLPCATPRTTCSRYSAWSAAAACGSPKRTRSGNSSLPSRAIAHPHHVEHLVLAESEHTVHQQRDHRHVERMRGRAVGLHLGQHADAQLAVDHHLGQQRTVLRLGSLRCALGPAGYEVGRIFPSTTWQLRCTAVRTCGWLRAGPTGWRALSAGVLANVNREKRQTRPICRSLHVDARHAYACSQTPCGASFNAGCAWTTRWPTSCAPRRRESRCDRSNDRARRSMVLPRWR